MMVFPEEVCTIRCFLKELLVHFYVNTLLYNRRMERAADIIALIHTHTHI